MPLKTNRLRAYFYHQAVQSMGSIANLLYLPIKVGKAVFDIAEMAQMLFQDLLEVRAR
jgi:hypothetical protein